jgi:hypothetical protein
MLDERSAARTQQAATHKRTLAAEARRVDAHRATSGRSTSGRPRTQQAVTRKANACPRKPDEWTRIA